MPQETLQRRFAGNKMFYFHVQTKYHNTCECVMIRLTHSTMLLVTARYSPMTSCSDDTVVVPVGMLWRIVR